MKLYKLKNVLAGVAFLTLIGLVISVSNVTGASNFFNLGQLISSEVKDNNDQVIMVVNGDPVTKKDYVIQKILLQTTNQKITDEIVKNKIIETHVLYQEAQRQGLEPSKNEAKEFALMQKDLLLSEPKPENADLILEYIKGQGLTVDEYFDANVEGYQKGLALANLRNAIYQEIDKEMGAEATIEAKNEAFTSLTSDLIAKANVEYNL